jgi:hypothetical protein
MRNVQVVDSGPMGVADMVAIQAHTHKKDINIDSHRSHPARGSYQGHGNSPQNDSEIVQSKTFRPFLQLVLMPARADHF